MSRVGRQVFLLGPSPWLEIGVLAPFDQPMGPSVRPGQTAHLSGPGMAVGTCLMKAEVGG